jgi:hypothetical protein
MELKNVTIKDGAITITKEALDAEVEFYHYNILTGHKAVTSAEYINEDNSIELC